jgi:hypothetical protein
MINTLKNKTSCGYDGVSNKIIKLCGDQIVKPLIYIYIYIYIICKFWHLSWPIEICKYYTMF